MLHLSRVATNIVANYAGSIAVGLLSLAFIPLYIKYLGIAGYGLVGFYLTLQSVFSILDLGLSVTLNRELALRSASPEAAVDARDLVRTSEMIYWPVAAFVGVIVVTTAPLIATHWVKSNDLSPATIQRAIALMGVSLALQWPSSLYFGGLQGVQRQVALNAILVIVAFVRGAGAVLILWAVSATVPAFFGWQIVSSTLQTLLAGTLLWRSLPVGRSRSVFRPDLLRNIRRFAAGVVGIGLVSTLLTQMDKVVLSKVLKLEQFGYYTLGAVVAATLYRLISPVFTALFPRFAQAAEREAEALPRLYHRGAQLLSVAIIPAAVVLIVFAPEILALWTGSAATAARTAPIARLLLAGTAINGLMNIPYAVQLAYGWTSLSLLTNVVSAVILLPGVYFASTRWGGVGAAAIWVVLNLGYLCIGVQFMFHRYLGGERVQWYAVDIGLPLLASVAMAGAARVLWVDGRDQFAQIAMLAVISAATLLSAAICTPEIRHGLLPMLHHLRNLRAGNSRVTGVDR